jgi:hypothetical protein
LICHCLVGGTSTIPTHSFCEHCKHCMLIGLDLFIAIHFSQPKLRTNLFGFFENDLLHAETH